MYSLPQEIEVWYIIPAIRKEFASVFIKKYKLTYEKAGEYLGVSKAAIAQYVSNKRANKIKITDEIKKEIGKSCKEIIKNSKPAFNEIQRILKIMKEKKCSCEACKKYNKNIINYCNCSPSYS